MKFIEQYFHCGDHLQATFAEQLGEVYDCVGAVPWKREFSLTVDGKKVAYQTAYNKALEIEFAERGWEIQPVLMKRPRFVGDFRKHLVFVEVQFGNSATLYRDYYKFQYGLGNGLLSVAVLIVPTDPDAFFPTRVKSVHNMAKYSLAEQYLTAMPINVPTLLIGLLPEN